MPGRPQASREARPPDGPVALDGQTLPGNASARMRYSRP
jgi:hypothetical protein